MATKLDYAIVVGGGPSVRWLAHDSVDDDDESSIAPPTTHNQEEALRTGDFAEVRKWLRDAANRYPNHEFREDLVQPLVLAEPPVKARRMTPR